MTKTVIIGRYEIHESLALLDADAATTAVAAFEAITSAATVGEARAALRAAVQQGAATPEDPDELKGEDADAFDWQGLPSVADGEWPPMATAEVIRWAPDSVVRDLLGVDGVKVESTIFNGEYLHIPLTAQAAVLEVLQRHGIEGRCDDAFVARFAVQETGIA